MNGLGNAFKKSESGKQVLNLSIYEVSSLNITEEFIEDALKKEFPSDYQQMYDNSPDVVNDPENGSRTTSPRFEDALTILSKSASGFCVG